MTRSGKGQRIRSAASAVAVTMVLLAVLGGCNYRWKAYQSTFQFRKLEFVSAMPAHKESDGTYTRQCIPDAGRTADSLLLSFNFIGTEPSSTTSTGETKDKDLAIRPGDLVKNPDNNLRDIIELADEVSEGSISETDFEVKISCLEPYPDPDISSVNRVCSKVQSIVGVPEKLDYRTNFPEGAVRVPVTDRSAVSMAIMIDQSGSMKGFVEPETFVEVGANSRVNRNNFAERATDSPAFRAVAAQTLMNQLNFNDRAGIFRFGEKVSTEQARILCDVATDSEDQARSECFGSNRSVLNSSDFASLQSDADGRTPLWQSVLDVYNFMKQSGGTRVRHIVVITDGPDTCHPDSPDYMSSVRYRRGDGKYAIEEQSSCSTVSYGAFFEAIKADVLNADGTPKALSDIPVHVSFIQMQSRGYQDIDPLQQETACLTGGHYMFINAGDITPSNETVAGQHPLQTALSNAVYKLRYAISGSWTVAVDVPDLENGLLREASEIAVEGHIRTNPPEGSVIPSLRSDMKVGFEEGLVQVGGLDTRGNFRVPSQNPGVDCSWVPRTDTTCETVALADVGGVCRSDLADAGTVCTNGACCWGICFESPAECKVLDASCNEVDAEDGTTCTNGTCDNGACVATAG